MTIIEKEVAAGIPLSRIVLGGLVRRGLVAFSGYQIQTVLGELSQCRVVPIRPETANVPLLMCHGEQDPFHSYPDMEHGACMDELDDVTKWLQRVIPETQK
ncbi:Alpha/Beta hydrolase fold [Phytophthora cactorum]|nr:Alpha/Beta hydrolase fold [Phytophthora cactorum]